MKEVFWAREFAWLVEPTPRDAAEGVVVRKQKEGVLVSVFEVAGDVTKGRS